MNQESEELLQFIRELRNKGYTISLLNDMNVVMNISDRIYVIDYGKKLHRGFLMKLPAMKM